MPYQVHTPAFSGPFDLLLHLILREQVDLYEIALSEIVDSYLVELEQMQRCDLSAATEFLLIAATLVELKTRRLLPDDAEVDLDEEFSVWSERDLLLARLVECKTFKDAAERLRRMLAATARSYPRRVGVSDERLAALAPDLLEGMTAGELRIAFLRASLPRPQPRVDISHLTPISLTVTDAVNELLEELPRIRSLTFRELTAASNDRIEVVVRFLALLELFKNGCVELDQDDASGTFGDITVRWTGTVAVPAGTVAIDSYDG